MHIDDKAMPTNDTDYSCYIAKNFRTCLTNHMSPLVINSLGGGYTHTDVHTKAILRHQVCTGLWPVHIWFKK